MFGLNKLFSRKKTPAVNDNPLSYPPVLLFNYNGQITNCSEIDRQFFGQMLGVTSFIDAEMNSFEKQVLQETERILGNPDELNRMLPRIPLVLPRLMKALRNEQSTAEEIAALISEDATLVAEVMRLTQSPFYRTRQKITSLKHAIVLLGREGIKRLTASAIMKPLLNARGGFFMQMSSVQLWEHSDKTANTAYRLPNDDEQQRFHTYLAGLMQNLGFTVGLKIMDKLFDSSSGNAPRSRNFLREFDRQCRVISLHIAKNWSMPEVIANAFALQSGALEIKATLLDQNLYVADRLAKTQMLEKRLEIDINQTSIMLDNKPCLVCRPLMNILTEPVENEQA